MRNQKITHINAKKALSTIWGWDGGYWYPLTESSRQDVLALSCPTLEKLLLEIEFEEFISEFYANHKMYEFTEHDGDSTFKSLEGFGYWHSELWLVNSNLKSLIYWSHEGTVTLAGNKLINRFKAYFPEWQLTLNELTE